MKTSDKKKRMPGYGWYIVLSFNIGIMGVGFGIYLSARHFFSAVESSHFFVVVGLCLLIIGGIATQITHVKHKNKCT